MHFDSLQVVIMAGGEGTRFWPLSTKHCPKQFLDILGLGRTLIQMTYDRVCPLVSAEQVWVITNQAYADLVHEQLPDIPLSHIVLEPRKCNTAPCLALAAHLLGGAQSDTTMLVLPSDHLITQESLFHEAVSAAYEKASEENALVTIGITPCRPDTGYGYIEVEGFTDGNRTQPYAVKSFREKPDFDTASKYLSQGNFLWNSGMFIWTVRSLCAALRAHCPDVYEAFHDVPADPTHPRFADLLSVAYSGLHPISIDYAVLEKARNVWVIPGNFQWSDLGSWPSVAGHLTQDANGNATTAHLVATECHRCVVHAPAGKLVVLRGLDDYLVALTDEALLVTPLGEGHDMRAIVETVRESGYSDFL